MRVRSFCLGTVLFFCALGLNAQENGVSFEDIALLETAVHDFLADEFQSQIDQGNEIAISVNRLDPRLRLHACDKALTFSLRDSGNEGGNLAVRTQCQGSVSWSIYVSAKVALRQEVYVASQNLPRGSVIAESDIVSTMMDTSTMGQLYATDPAQLVGKELTRTVGQGQALRLNNVTEPKVIRRGDAVLIEASSGAVMVASSGIALSDGKVGQQIRIRNESSKREVRVEVLGPGRVRALL